MRRSFHAFAAALVLLLADDSSCQVGTIAIVKNSSSLFSILNPVTGAVTTHNIGAYLPGTGATASSLLFESSTALQRRWLVGGTGFIGRVTIAFDLFTQSTTVGYTVLANSLNAHQLIGRNAAGDVFFADTATDQVMRLDSGGAVSPVTAGPQPWGSGLLAGTIHSVSGELFLGSDGGRVFRLPPGASTATIFGPTQPLAQARIVNLVADPLSTSVVAIVRSTVSGAFNRLVRIAATGAVQDFPAVATVDGLGLAVDPNGDFIISQALGNVLRIANSGAIQFLAGTVTTPAFPRWGTGAAPGRRPESRDALFHLSSGRRGHPAGARRDAVPGSRRSGPGASGLRRRRSGPSQVPDPRNRGGGPELERVDPDRRGLEPGSGVGGAARLRDLGTEARRAPGVECARAKVEPISIRSRHRIEPVRDRREPR